MSKSKSNKKGTAKSSGSEQSSCQDDRTTVSETPEIVDYLSFVADMAAGAAHEINNPLAVISGRAQLMAEKARKPEDKKVWETITIQAQRISDIITDLMKFASPPHPEPKDTEIGKIMEDALFYFYSLNNLNPKAVKIDKSIENRLPSVRVDPVQIVAVIQELLLNAVNAAESELYISIKAMPVSGGKQVHLMIRDNGPGMDAKTLASAFTPFFSTQSAGRRRGLGLPMAWRYVVNNQGRLWIESQPGEGTTVHVTLAAAKS